MGLYIKDMKMPNFGYREIRIYPNGRVMEEDECGIEEVIGTAEQVQLHGRLIDTGALWVKINKICDRRDAGIITDLTCLQQILSAVRHAPTIIPAEEDET